MIEEMFASEAAGEGEGIGEQTRHPLNGGELSFFGFLLLWHGGPGKQRIKWKLV